MEEALVLFSGGKDSFLSTILALEEGYKVDLVVYDNKMSLKYNNALVGAKRIQKKYGIDKVNIVGIKKTDAIWRELICDFYNLDTEFIYNQFGKVTISQYNCLSCRLAMYILSIIICKQNNIRYVIDGARKSQLFAIEQPKFINKFQKLFREYNITIKYPLLNEENDFTIKNQILARGFVPKMNEAQCLLGMPIHKEINEDIIESLIKVFDKNLYPKINDILNRYKDTKFEGEYV